MSRSNVTRGYGLLEGFLAKQRSTMANRLITTPALWTDSILRFMAKLRIVSPVEIEEHKDAYNHSRLFSILQEANFSKEKLRFGYFEMFMNMWATATK